MVLLAAQFTPNNVTMPFFYAITKGHVAILATKTSLSILCATVDSEILAAYKTIQSKQLYNRPTFLFGCLCCCPSVAAANKNPSKDRLITILMEWSDRLTQPLSKLEVATQQITKMNNNCVFLHDSPT
jgi:hypothetical protein